MLVLLFFLITSPLHAFVTQTKIHAYVMLMSAQSLTCSYLRNCDVPRDIENIARHRDIEGAHSMPFSFDAPRAVSSKR